MVEPALQILLLLLDSLAFVVIRIQDWYARNLVSIEITAFSFCANYYAHGSRVEQLLYKNYFNVLTKTKTIAKKLYYHQKPGEYYNNQKKKRGIFFEPYCIQNLLLRCLTLSLLTIPQ